jgi:hypothetical protein
MSALDVSELNMAKIEKFPLTDGESINDECTFKHKIALATKEIMALTNTGVVYNENGIVAFTTEAMTEKECTTLSDKLGKVESAIRILD